MRVQGKLHISVIAVSAVVGSLVAGSPAHASATASEEVAPVSVEAAVWQPSGELMPVTKGSAPEVPWEPGLLGSTVVDSTRSGGVEDPAPSETNARAAEVIDIGPGTGDTGYYSFMDFPVLSGDGSTQVRVNIGNGNLLVQANDSAISGPGAGIEVNRIWNSLQSNGSGASWYTNVSSLGLSVSPDHVTFTGKTGEKAQFIDSIPRG